MKKIKAHLQDKSDLKRTLLRISHEIIENNSSSDEIVLIGIHNRGVPLASRIKKEIFDINGTCTNVSNWIKILNSLDPNVDIDFEGDPLPFPFDIPDDHIRNFLGKYPSVDLKEGIRETYNSFKVLIDRGLIKKT